MTRFNTFATRALVVVAGLSTLAACSAEPGYGNAFTKDAGGQLDNFGEFGNATLHNQLVQTCRANGSGFGKAGAGAGDPVVVLDPASTPTRQIYRVHCDGNLDGKYASVIYDEYVRSAPRQDTVDEATGE